MSRSFIGRLIVAIAALVSIIGGLIFLLFPMLTGHTAIAATTHGAGIVRIPIQTPPATLTPTVTPTPTPGAPFLTPDLFIPFLFILLPFGLILIAGLLFYIYRVQMKYYAAMQRLSQMGVGVKAVPMPAFETPPGALRGEKPNNITIDGPGFPAVGTQAEYTATPDKDGGSPDQVNWSGDPKDAASCDPKKGAKTTVTPLKIGSFKVIASIGDDPNAPTAAGAASVTAIAPKATTEELPFIGQGYGSLVIAVLVVVAVIILALTGVLGGEAVATLFGGLLGYIFGVTTAGGGGGGQPPKKTNGQTPSTTG